MAAAYNQFQVFKQNDSTNFKSKACSSYWCSNYSINNMYGIVKMTTIQVKQQIIRSMIENFDWETNPDWDESWKEIYREIAEYWIDFKQ